MIEYGVRFAGGHVQAYPELRWAEESAEMSGGVVVTRVMPDWEELV